MVTLAVHVGQPTDPNASILSLVAETSEVRPGTFATVLHTGVCIRNTTGIKLEVGVQSPVGMALGDPHLLGVLGPGSSAWLPAPIADSAVLCMRPCCSYRSDSLGQGAWSRPSKSGDEFRRPPTATLGPPGIVYRSTNQLPAQRSSSASLQGQATGHRYEWSAGIPLVQLLPEKQGIPSGAHGPLPRHIACPVAAEENEVPLVLLLAAQPYGE